MPYRKGTTIGHWARWHAKKKSCQLLQHWVIDSIVIPEQWNTSGLNVVCKLVETSVHQARFLTFHYQNSIQFKRLHVRMIIWKGEFSVFKWRLIAMVPICLPADNFPNFRTGHHKGLTADWRKVEACTTRWLAWQRACRRQNGNMNNTGLMYSWCERTSVWWSCRRRTLRCTPVQALKWSKHRSLQMNHAVVFCTDCRRRTRYVGRPISTLFPWSSLDITKACE